MIYCLLWDSLNHPSMLLHKSYHSYHNISDSGKKLIKDTLVFISNIANVL